MRKTIIILISAMIDMILFGFCGGRAFAQVSYKFPDEVSLLSARTGLNQLWAFVAKSPLYEPGKPIQLDSEYSVFRFDAELKLDGESPLSVGALRASDRQVACGLALIVKGIHEGNPVSVLYLTNDSGKTWSSNIVAPVAAVGASFLEKLGIAVWTEKQVFISRDWGRTWTEIKSNTPRLNFSRVCLPIAIESRQGIPLIGVEYNRETRKTYSHFGVLNLQGEFDEKLRVEGRVMCVSQDGKGVLWVVLLLDRDRPTTKVIAIENLKEDVHFKLVREIIGSVPDSVYTVNDQVLIVYAKCAVGSKMPMEAEIGTSDPSNEKFDWKRVDFGGIKPDKAFFDSNKGVWLYTKSDNRLIYLR